MSLNLLGRAPSTLGHQYESLSLHVESTPGGGNFVAVPWLLGGCEVVIGCNDRLPISEISINLARDVSRSVEWSENEPRQRDWQVFNGSAFVNALEFFGSNRRVQIRTARPVAADDWILFDGYIERPQLTWSGSAASRVLKLWTTSSIVAADREVNQFHVGQWRRSRRASIALYDDEAEEAERNECIRVTSIPCVFNPGGQGNCSNASLGYAEGSRGVDAFCFEDYSPPATQPAIKWNVARILAYIWWAALQPALVRPATPEELPKPYDLTTVRSSPTHPEELNWTTIGLAHLPWAPQYEPAHGLPITEAGPNLYTLIEDYLDRTDEGSQSDPQERALLRTPSDLSIEGMSTLEAFVHVCDRAGLLCNVAHDVGVNGRVYTYLRFTVRGDRCGPGIPGGESGGLDFAQPSPTQPGGSAQLTTPETCTARGVYLYVSSDRYDLDDSPPAGSAAQQIATMLRRDSAFEGSLTLDEASHRAAVVEIGDPTLYEISVMLLPGWLPDVFWDREALDEATVRTAIGQIASPTGQERYGRASTLSNLSYRLVGRWWVLNEDGHFSGVGQDDNALYKRQVGPWSDNAAWEPFKWRTTGQVFELATRGDDGWSARRRQFLPLTTYFNGRVAEPLVELSFNSGVNWYDARQVSADVSIDQDRCAVTINNPNLEQIINPNPVSHGRHNYVEAYLAGTLRVRVTALVAGDDALLAWSNAGTHFDGMPWVDIVSRRGKLTRTLRYRPGTTTPAASNAILSSTNASLYLGENLDRQTDALRHALQVADEVAMPRVAGSVTIPWLWRDGRGPVIGYRIGDEVLGVQTGLSTTHWSFTGNRNPRYAATRIIGIRYRWSDGEQSTTLELEDRSFSPDGGVVEPSRRDVAQRSVEAYMRRVEARRAGGQY